jgi:hypothetical protein
MLTGLATLPNGNGMVTATIGGRNEMCYMYDSLLTVSRAALLSDNCRPDREVVISVSTVLGLLQQLLPNEEQLNEGLNPLCAAKGEEAADARVL